MDAIATLQHDLDRERNERRDGDQAIRETLRRDYLTADQMKLTFVTKDEAQAGRAAGRDRLLLLCALAGSLSTILSILERITGH